MIALKIVKRLMEIVPLLNAINIGIIPVKCQGKRGSQNPRLILPEVVVESLGG